MFHDIVDFGEILIDEDRFFYYIMRLLQDMYA